MARQSLSQADIIRGTKLKDLGCIVCLIDLDLFTPCGIHHIDGQTKTGCHQKTLGLCGNHHQIPDNNKPKRWISRHGDGRAAFEAAYGTEQELLERTNGLVTI